MKLAFITDIHEDYGALSLILKNIDNKFNVDQVLCLGDIVGFNKQYNNHYKKERSAEDCIKNLIYSNTISILGNHDAHFLNINEKLDNSNTYDYNDEEIKLSTKSLDYLKKCPEKFIIKNQLLITHFLYPNNVGRYKVNNNHIELIKSHFKKMIENKVNFSFIGHLHTPTLQLITNKKAYELEEGKVIKLNPQELNIINCPPVSRDNNRKTNITFFDTINKELYWVKLEVI